jgi:hypothetical protein
MNAYQKVFGLHTKNKKTPPHYEGQENNIAHQNKM